MTTLNKRELGGFAMVVATTVLITGASKAFAQTTEEAAVRAKKLLAAVPAHGERCLGDPKAPITMIEYASATCPHCAEFHFKVWPGIKSDYIDTGKVFFIFREFPTDDLALGAFMLARCIPEVKYFDTIDLMLLQQKFWMKGNPKEELFNIVADMGLSTADAEACIQNQDLANSIRAVLKVANTEFSVKGTPTFFVNGSLLDGHDDPSVVRKGIDAELKKLGF